jgi:2-C-methyl-D-erythritol 4-phosphate cytidylyltransferase
VTDTVGAVLVAAGASRRMGFDKVWAPLGDRPVAGHALSVLASSAQITQLAIVVSSDRLADAGVLATGLPRAAVVCQGGADRRDSVSAGLEALDACEWVLVHDAARPFLTPRLIDLALDAVRATGAAVAAVPARDTVKRVADGLVLETLPRGEIWSVQTPQVFRTALLRCALLSTDRDVTDEATLVERMGGQVSVFRGAESNFKITAPGDLERAEAWLAHLRRADTGRSGDGSGE